MADDPSDRPIQTPRAWTDFRNTLGRHVPSRVAQIQASGRRIRALGQNRPKPKAKP